MLIVGATAFMAAELLYGSRGPDSGATQFILYGLVGFVPATISSWLAHEAIDRPVVAMSGGTGAGDGCRDTWPGAAGNLRRLWAFPI